MGPSGLFGDSIIERARIRELERMFDVYVMKNVGLYAHNVAPFFAPHCKQSPDAAEQALIDLDKAAAAISSLNIGSEYLLYDKLTVADLTAFPVLEFCEVVAATGWHAQTSLLAWYTSFKGKAAAIAAKAA